MVQNPKGGGLSFFILVVHKFGGVQKQLTFLDKSTWTLDWNFNYENLLMGPRFKF